jgi:ribosomal protein S18 acetylase RimI-like enzyme
VRLAHEGSGDELVGCRGNSLRQNLAQGTAHGGIRGTPVSLHLPALIAAHMRGIAARRPGSKTGPFVIGLDLHSDDPMRNYAVPDHDASPTASDVDALIAFFRQSHRTPRLEYIEEDAPRVWPALAAEGFTVERRTPVMTATPATRLTPRSPAGITIRQAASEPELTAAATVQHHAYEVPSPPGLHDIARLTSLVQRGGFVANAIDDSSGATVGTGLVDVAGDRPAVGELAAVGVLTSFRRRGIASALSAQLARTATHTASRWSSSKPSPPKSRSTAAPGSSTLQSSLDLDPLIRCGDMFSGHRWRGARWGRAKRGARWGRAVGARSGTTLDLKT